ncbi:MAG TPA: hypothetical protein VMZ30_15920 [Pyrinomonadaceae bacterium]|nr:hypothetical protein [Pyrinomonadaceae bacterium]
MTEQLSKSDVAEVGGDLIRVSSWCFSVTSWFVRFCLGGNEPRNYTKGKTKPNKTDYDSSIDPVAYGVSKKRPRLPLLELSLFLFVWSVYGVAINSANLKAFNLQQAGIEAMVERRQFSLEGSATPQFQIRVYYDGDKPFGDTFMYNGRQYAAKQPGQFMLGAVVYFFLRLFGLSYSAHYTLTSALVTFFTSSLVTAAATLAVFRVARLLTVSESLSWPLASAFLYGFGTTAFAYSGFAYHDTLASGYLVIAFYLVVLLARQQVSLRNAPLVAAAAGVLLGATLTTSMLPFFMACVVGVYLVSRSKVTLAALTGELVGLAPLFLYNARSFGNPLLNSYSAGGYPESFLSFNLHNSIEKTWLYISEVTLYDPIAWLGILALAFYPRAFRREVLVILGLFVAQMFQVLNIESHGGCHYGPRFLLPALPYAALGLAGFHYLRSKGTRRATIGVGLVGAVSVVVNAVGALYGAMYCDVQVYAFWPGLAALQRGGLIDLRLARWLVIPVIFSLFLFVYSIRPKRSGGKPTFPTMR